MHAASSLLPAKGDWRNPRSNRSKAGHKHLERSMPCRSRSKRNDRAAAGTRRVPARSHAGRAPPHPSSHPTALPTYPQAKALVAQVCLEASYMASQQSPCQDHSKQQVCAATALPFLPSGQAQDGSDSRHVLMSAKPGCNPSSLCWDLLQRCLPVNTVAIILQQRTDAEFCCSGHAPQHVHASTTGGQSQARRVSVHVWPQEGASADVAPPAAARSWQEPAEPAWGPAARAASNPSLSAAQCSAPAASAAHEQSALLPMPKLSSAAEAASPDFGGVRVTTPPKAECAAGSFSASDNDQLQTVSSSKSSLHLH